MAANPIRSEARSCRGLAPREAIKITAALSLLIAGLFGILGFRRRRTA
jgi:hypothetical protein